MGRPEKHGNPVAEETTGPRHLESDIVDRLLGDEPDALRDFYEGNFDAVYRFVYLLVGGHHQDAEEAVQNTFLAAIQSLRSFKGRGNVRTWLFGIARHKAADVRRKGSLQLGLWQKLVTMAEGSRTTKDAEADAVTVKTDVERVLLSLPSDYREVLVLKYVQDLAVEQVATIMGRSAKATESLLSRARTAFRKQGLG